jgi:hypothetical protein
MLWYLISSLVWPWCCLGPRCTPLHLAAVDIGAGKGITLVNSAAVLVLTTPYGRFGGISGRIGRSSFNGPPALAFPIALIGIAILGGCHAGQNETPWARIARQSPTLAMPLRIFLFCEDLSAVTGIQLPWHRFS